MSLTTYPRLEQGSDAWLKTRAGIITASAIGQLITTKTMKPAANETARALTAHLAAERITGYVEETFTSMDMERGNLDEPLARDAYAKHYAATSTVQELGFMVRDDDGPRVGFSPDGLVDDDGFIEIKSRRQKKHLATILADQVPAENMAQIQCGFYVSGRDWCDYLSYCGGMPLYRIRVTPDPAWQAAIVEAAQTFEANVSQMIATYDERTKHAPPTERIDHFKEPEIVIK